MKVAMFILLKLLEITIVVFVPHYLGRLVCLLPWIGRDGAPYWLFGILAMLLALIFVFTVFGIYALILANWELAGKIMKKIK